PAGAGGAGDVVDHAQDADDGGRVDRRVDLPRRTGAVVQGDVPAGDGHAELGARVGQAGDRLDELPHGVRVLGGAEVQAVGDGGGLGADRRDVPVGLCERLLRPGVRVELGEAAVGVGADRHAQAGGLVDADHAGVVGLGEGGVALDVPVVLVGDPGLAREVGRAGEAQHLLAQLLGRGGPREPLGGVGVEVVLPGRAGVGAVVDRALVRDGPRVDVDDALAVVVDDEAAGVGDLSDDGGL